MTPALISQLVAALHLLSVSAWIGLMIFFLWVFAPAADQLSPRAAAALLSRGREYFQGTASLLIIAALLTGMIGVAARIVGGAGADSMFTWILGLKILLFVAMAVHHVLQAAKYSPKPAEPTAENAPDAQAWAEPLLASWRRWFLLLKMNVVLGAFALLLGLLLKSR